MSSLTALLSGPDRDAFLKDHFSLAAVPAPKLEQSQSQSPKPEPAPKSNTGKNKPALCNGWKNRATWNIALWISSDEHLYRSACRFMKEYKGRDPYTQFIHSSGLRYSRTPDHFKYLSSRLSYKELNDMMFDLIS